MSLAAIFVRWALPAPPIVTGFYRMLFAAMALTAFAIVARRATRLPRRGALLAVAAGACFGGDLALWHTSIVATTVALATLLVNLTPVHVGLFALLVWHQRLRPRFVTGAALALGGTTALLGLPAGGVDDTQGALLAIGASLFYAAYLLLMVEARRECGAFEALFLMTLSACAVLGMTGLAVGDAFRGFPGSAWAAMLGAALLTQLGGVMGLVWSLRHLPATLASVVLLGQPVGTAILGWWLFGEALGAAQLAGGGAVLAGIALASRAGPPTPSRLTVPAHSRNGRGRHQG